jgi:hypothetical protein
MDTSVCAAMYEEMHAAGWREAALAQPTDWHRRLAGMQLAMKANAEIAKTLERTGVFDAAPMHRAIKDTEDGPAKGVNVLKELAEGFLQGGYAGARTRRRLIDQNSLPDEED